MGLLAARAGHHRATFKLMHIANLVATLAAMHFKHKFQRPRPSQLCPALKPPLEVPGHASYPSGHATQAFLMAACLKEALTGSPHAVAAPVLDALAARIATNREIAGLHYRSDTLGGQALAANLLVALKDVRSFKTTVAAAKKEWA
jgi:membrane-associated phospholipid phosphatase